MKSLLVIDLCRGMVLTALIISPFNIQVLPGLRPADLLLIAAIMVAALSTQKARVKTVALLTAVAAIILTKAAPLIGSTSDLERLVFAYKYVLLILVPMHCYHLFATKEINVAWIERLGTAIIVHLWIMILWAIAYNVGAREGLIEGNWRVSFPLSPDYNFNDSHLYSSVLGLSVLTYISVLRKVFRHGKLTTLVTVLAAATALTLTGSRSGIAMLFVGVLLWQAQNFRIVSLLKVCMLSALGVLLATSVMPANALLQRALSFDLTGDASALGRINKLQIAFAEVWEGGLLLGVGFNDASLTWYDGLHSIVMAHWGVSGLAALFIVAVYLLVAIRNLPPNRLRAREALFAAFVAVFLANLITEYALVTRALLPFTLCLMCLLAVSKLLNDSEIHTKIGRHMQ